jgi:hypothetical protein
MTQSSVPPSSEPSQEKLPGTLIVVAEITIANVRLASGPLSEPGGCASAQEQSPLRT